MSILDLDPNVVKPGWTALIITILLAFSLVLLYLSMRRQFRKINFDDETDVEPAEDGEAGEDGTSRRIRTRRPPSPEQHAALLGSWERLRSS